MKRRVSATDALSAHGSEVAASQRIFTPRADATGWLATGGRGPRKKLATGKPHCNRKTRCFLKTFKLAATGVPFRSVFVAPAVDRAVLCGF